MILMSKRILAAACAAATALALSACSPSASTGGKTSKDGTLTVMASFYPLQYLAAKVGGEHVTVTSLTPAGAEPHDLELSPKMVDSLSNADAVVYLAGFQSAVDEAIEQQAPKTVIDVSSAAELVEATSQAAFAGRYAPEKVGFLKRLLFWVLAKKPGDHVDPPVIRAWARALTLDPAAPPGSAS